MKISNHTIILLFAAAVCLGGCQKMQQNRLNHQMKRMAKTYLQQEEISGYKHLMVTSVDTLTEFGYAKLTSELLGNMETAYGQMYMDDSDDTNRREVIGLYLRETHRIKTDMDELIDNGDLQTEGILLFMVTGKYTKNDEEKEFMFLAKPDRKTMHTLDPFGNNLLYKDEE